ncbi:Ig-like domain-containing protein, partial [Bradyrhizobium sp. LMTR 3]|uniref:Ig-like domain-containing protein n=1 Tax=Bradyrhizobium sp. LMTR 3 TaxID=189873 RepID=UPI0008106CBC
SAPPATPATPTIASFSNDTGAAGDGITSDNTLQLKGTAAANSTIKIYDGSTQIGTTTASSTGSWDYITSVLTNAKHVLTATATTSSGQTSAASGAVTVTVDTVAPTAPVLSSNAIVNTNQVKLSGTAEANSKVTIYDGSTVVGTGTTNSTGAWSVTTNALSTGTHTLTAKAADVAGNVSAASQSINSVISGSTTPTPSTQIESAGATSLVQIGENYALYGASGSGPTLKAYGAAVVEGQSGGWVPIGVEQTASGYQVAWKLTGKDQYGVWNTDKSGNLVSHTNVMSGSALKSIEASFQQDLNGDGTVGLASKTIEAAGSTSLVQVGENFSLSGGGAGPTLKAYGAAVVEGQSGGWTPIGVEQTATGYQVAWKLTGKDQYGVWNIDKGGNLVSHTSIMTGSALKSFEASFQQDLNGDGLIAGSSAGAPISSVGLTTMYKNWSDIVTIKGIADANSQIKLYDGNTSIGKVTAAADGTWSFQTSSAVSDTVHTYTAKQIDSAGQVVGASGSAILGSTASNTLKSTSGNDILVGGGQSDTFVFAANFGRDVIKDFAASGTAQDTIQFSKTVFDSFASVLSHASQVGQDIVISAGSDTLTLKNTKLSALNSSDFHFA